MKLELRIEAIIAHIKSLRPHNEKCDLMLVTQDELTNILNEHLKDTFEDASKYKELCK